jgi:hypothetical protein
MEPKEIKKRFEALWSDRKIVEQQWQTIEGYVAPYRGKFFKENAGEASIEWKSNRHIYDATAVQAHIQLANSIHGSMTNPAIVWFEMQWRNPELQDNYDAKIWLENAGKRIYDELQDSNFNLEANNTYRNLTSFATAAIMEEPKADITEPWKGVQFTSVPIKQVYFEPDENGQAYNFYRLLQWRPSKLVSKFGYDNLPQTIQQQYDSSQDLAVQVIFAVYTRKDKLNQKETVLTEENRPYGWAYLLRDDASVIKSGGYYEMPAFIPRWEVTDESMWGNGPAHYALADILTLNEMVALDLRSREKVIDPALLVQERAILNNLDLSPGAQNVVRDVTQIKPFESAARFDAVEATIMRLQSSVQKYFYIDQLELKESPAMTATEVQVRYELMQRLLSSTMARLKEDFLDPLLTRTFNLLYRAGEFDDLPEGVELTDYDIEYIGPLSRSMKFDQSASIERWITQLQLIAQNGGPAEEVLLVPDYDKLARMAADNLNLPTELTRSPEDVAADVEQQKAQASRQASAEAASAEAAAAKDLGQAEQLAAGDPSIATGGL